MSFSPVKKASSNIPVSKKMEKEEKDKNSKNKGLNRADSDKKISFTPRKVDPGPRLQKLLDKHQITISQGNGKLSNLSPKKEEKEKNLVSETTPQKDPKLIMEEKNFEIGLNPTHVKERSFSLNDMTTNPFTIPNNNRGLRKTMHNLSPLSSSQSEPTLPCNLITRKTGSFGLNVKDVQEFLPKLKPSEDHKEISQFLKEGLLNLKEPILVRPGDDSKKLNTKNAVKFLQWIDQDQVSDSPILNLFLYEQALKEIVHLLEQVIQTDRDVSKFFDKDKIVAITEIAHVYKVTEKIAIQFYEINKCLHEIYKGKENEKNSFILTRYVEMIELYKNYIPYIRNRTEALLKKDPRFQFYFPNDQKKAKTQEEKNNREIIQSALNTLGTFGKSIRNHTNAGKAHEWDYILSSGALQIYEGSNRLFPKDQEQLKGEVKVKVIFCEILDCIARHLKLNNDPGFINLKEYFINGKPLENNFKFDAFLNCLGFEHHFGLDNQQMLSIQELLTKENGNWDKVKKQAAIEENLPLNNFLNIFSRAPLPREDSKESLLKTCQQLEKMCQILYQVESDKKDTRKELLKLLVILKFVNQENAITYLHRTFNTLHFQIMQEYMLTSLHDYDKPTKRYEFHFINDQIVFKGSSSYDIKQAPKKGICIVEECLTVTLKVDDLLDSSKWEESYAVDIILREPIPDEKLRKHFDILLINLFQNNIPFRIHKEYKRTKVQGNPS